MKTYTVTVDDYGSKFWRLNGKRHREDGPADEYHNGTKCWYLDDKFHRTDGPAIEWNTGIKCWFLDGVEYSESDWRNKLKAPCEDKVVEVEGVKYKLVKI